MEKNIEIKRASVNEKASRACEPLGEKTSKKNWETPKLEDVSGKIMAQPYIRFT